LHGFRVVPGDDVADHNQVRTVVNILRPIAIHDPDALLLQKSAHGRVNFLIGAGDFKTKISQHTGQGPHARPADGNQMNCADVFVNSIFVHIQHSINQLSSNRERR
jgi:hypothetical protein